MQVIKQHFFKHKLAPGPRGHLLLGSLLELWHQGQLQLFLNAWYQFGDVVRLRMGPKIVHLVAHPEHIQHILVDNHQRYCKGIGYKKLGLLLGQGLLTSEGELWQRQRRLMQPSFTESRIRQFAVDITDSTSEMLERWQTCAESNNALEINLEMLRLTMNVIGKTLLSINTIDETTEVGHALRMALDYICQRVLTLFNVPLFIPTPSNCPFKRARRTVDEFIYHLIEARRCSEETNDDLFSKLLQAQDTQSNTGMSAKQLRDEVITIFLAGSETTANTLTWTWYLLSQHPEVERKLHAEITAVLGGRTPTVNDLLYLEYTRRVIEESMRLYPPVWAISRDAIEDDEIGGYHIPAGSMVFISQYITHRHPGFWVEPEMFNPDRFESHLDKKRLQHAYFPFGSGPRTCLGINLAMLESQLILATVVQRYQLRLVPNHPVEPIAESTLRPRYGLKMSLQRR